ncbi:BTAD domain-containing putative transcriptional regulator [Glycomyces niveus]|uniref:Winged helix-turn-helix domain-containing protein n=1 Tax=Glycomyces niveus TaxID=2820287 RepID=A0ABS3TZJ8_9ACTN|nr:BTAD domain-containing putative transcriptional regulator [Glycomyces sp. NEAU-S30]MBO3731935.1 winged helix-turn-helix domain-containing protein [Glycomyces sp. NEAU-S30]
MRVRIGVLGPVLAWDDAGSELDLKGPRHRAVLARLVVARGRVVPVDRLVDDLWGAAPGAGPGSAPAGGVGAVRTFVAALRRSLEPDRPPRTPARLLVTEGPGYALRVDAEAVDAWRFEAAVAEAGGAAPHQALALLDRALGEWRGPAYADFDEAWAGNERSRLEQLRLDAVERRGGALLALGRPGEAVPELDALVAEHPWREEAWRSLALALYRSGRQADALAVLRRAKSLLDERHGVEPNVRLRRLEADLLRQVDPDAEGAEQVWAATAAAYDQTVGPESPARLESTVGLLRSLAFTGGTGLVAAQEQWAATVAAAERLDDPELAARVIGGYDVPAIWTRSDDPARSARIAAAAEHALAQLGSDAHDVDKARLLAVIAVESRGVPGPRPAEAAAEAERLARGLGDPALLAFALNGVFMQAFHRTGLAPERDRIGAELVALAARHRLPAYEILGHLIRLQARSALADFAGADTHAAAADALAARHERPLTGVFTDWYRAMRLAVHGSPSEEVEAAYRAAAARLDGAGMPGVQRGLLPLALLCLRLGEGLPLGFPAGTDWGPYEPWTRPLILLDAGRRGEAAAVLRRTPAPSGDLLTEALWALTARAAIALGDKETMARAEAALSPAEGELTAGSGMLSAGPVSAFLAELRMATQ